MYGMWTTFLLLMPFPLLLSPSAPLFTSDVANNVQLNDYQLLVEQLVPVVSGPRECSLRDSR